jgi:hypothetical protein
MRTGGLRRKHGAWKAKKKKKKKKNMPKECEVDSE